VDGRTVVVLGGGVGGVTAANELRALLGSDHRVILIEQQRDHVFAPSFLWLMTGDRRPDQVRRKLSTLLRDGVELVEAEITGLDLERKVVIARDQEYRYDALIVALGAALSLGTPTPP
jgi:sulfide:quinone oxidoreductase